MHSPRIKARKGFEPSTTHNRTFVWRRVLCQLSYWPVFGRTGLPLLHVAMSNLMGSSISMTGNSLKGYVQNELRIC